MRLRRALVATLAVGLLATSCSDDDGAEAGTFTTAPDATEPSPTEPTTSDRTPASDPPSASDAPTPTDVKLLTIPPEPGDPGTLTDSYQGVTADTILVGYPYIDFDALNRGFGLELTFANFAPAMETMVTDLNDRGGINGRRVELLPRPFIPVGQDQADAICIELTEDIGVFAVLGGFAGPGAGDVNECFTDIHATILVGGNPTPEQLERAKAPWISNGMSRTRRAAALVDLLVAEGRLAELGDLAVIASTVTDGPVVDAARDAFTAAGTEVAFDATVSTTGEELLTRQEVDTFIERGRTEGVDTFLFIGDDAYANEQLILAGDEFNLLWLDSGQVVGWRTDPPPGIEDTRLILATGGRRPDPSDRDDPEWGDCVALTDEAYGLEVTPTPGRGETDYWTAMVNACLTVRLFEHVATAAGADLTNESFAAAAEAFGDYAMPGTPFASLGPDKHDGSDTVRLTIWDLDAGEWRAISDPFDTTP